MSQLIVKTNSQTRSWNSKSRYRVGESTNHNGFTWANLTGANGEPGITLDWIAISSDSVSSKATVIVNGNLFTLNKHTLNNDPLNLSDLEVNDMITDAYWDDTTFWLMAMYLGGDKDVIGSWNQINPIEDLVVI